MVRTQRAAVVFDPDVAVFVGQQESYFVKIGFSQGGNDIHLHLAGIMEAETDLTATSPGKAVVKQFQGQGAVTNLHGGGSHYPSLFAGGSALVDGGGQLGQVRQIPMAAENNGHGFGFGL